MSWLKGTPPETGVRAADVIEAETRRRMARVTKARGWDVRRVRDVELEDIDILLDRWLELQG